MKRLIGILLALVLLLTGVSAMAEEKPTIGFILGDMVNVFYLQMIEAGDQAAADYGVEVIWQSCDSSVEKEVSLIENFILQGVDCIVLDPMDAAGVVAACNKATEAGIPVVTCANNVEADANYMTLYTDRLNIERATTALCYAIGQEGTVGLLSGDTGSWVINERETGFKDAIAKFEKIEGDIQLTHYDNAVAATITENWINTTGVDAIMAVSDSYNLASVTAAQNLGVAEEIVWGGNDGNIENHDIMNQGYQLIDHLTGGYRVGYWNVAAAARLCKGEELPRYMYLKCHTVMTEETAAKLAELGFECEYITPEEAAVIAVDCTNEYGPQIDAATFAGEGAHN